MKDDIILGVGNVTAWSLTLAQFKETAEAISYILASIASLLTVAYIIYKWYKRATSEDSKGGKSITLEEIEELKEEVDNYGDKDRRQDL